MRKYIIPWTGTEIQSYAQRKFIVVKHGVNMKTELPVVLRDQHLRFLFLWETEKKKVPVHPGTPEPLPNDVIAFAEDLMLCPTEESALTRIGRGLIVARAFHAMSQSLASEVEKGNVQISIPTDPNRTPFFVLSACVRDWLKTRVEKIGNRWNPEK